MEIVKLELDKSLITENENDDNYPNTSMDIHLTSSTLTKKSSVFSTSLTIPSPSSYPKKSLSISNSYSDDEISRSPMTNSKRKPQNNVIHASLLNTMQNFNFNNNNKMDDDEDEIDHRNKSAFELEIPPLQFSDNVDPDRRHKRSASVPSCQLYQKQHKNVKYKHKYRTLKERIRRQSVTLQQYSEKINDIQDETEDEKEKLIKIHAVQVDELQQKLTKKHSLEVDELNKKLTKESYENSNLRKLIVEQQKQLEILKNALTKKYTSPNTINPYHSSSNEACDDDTSSDDSITDDSSDDDDDSNSFSDQSDDDDDDYDEDTQSDYHQDEDEQYNNDIHDKNKINITQQKNKKIKQKRKAKKLKSIPDHLKNDLSEKQPKGFWSKAWNFFGPPGVVCSCSDNR